MFQLAGACQSTLKGRGRINFSSAIRALRLLFLCRSNDEQPKLRTNWSVQRTAASPVNLSVRAPVGSRSYCGWCSCCLSVSDLTLPLGYSGVACHQSNQQHRQRVEQHVTNLRLCKCNFSISVSSSCTSKRCIISLLLLHEEQKQLRSNPHGYTT